MVKIRPFDVTTEFTLLPNSWVRHQGGPATQRSFRGEPTCLSFATALPLASYR